MQIGIHLPQYGRVASSEAVTRAARHAEQLGYAGVWVSDHIVQPAAQDYPSPYLYDPLVTLTWAAAVTEEIGLGTSVLVVPQHHPLELANQLASLDDLSGGRLTVGVGVGWSAAEFAALDQDFSTRGARIDEALRIWRAVWEQDPATLPRRPLRLRGPARAAAAGASHPDLGRRLRSRRSPTSRRAGRRVPPHQRHAGAGRGARSPRCAPSDPSAEFVISLRTGWDPQGMDPDRDPRRARRLRRGRRVLRRRPRPGGPRSTTGSGAWTCSPRSVA